MSLKGDPESRGRYVSRTYKVVTRNDVGLWSGILGMNV